MNAAQTRASGDRASPLQGGFFAAQARRAEAFGQRPRTRPYVGVWLSLLLVLSACGRADKPETPAAADVGPAVFEVLATSDLKDAQALEGMVEKATGVKLRFRFGGTMESTEAVLSGRAGTPAAWFANAKYLLSDPQGQRLVRRQEKIMFSPIAVGVSTSVAQQLGWHQAAKAARLGWKDITEAAANGQLRYAVSNPATSNQGFMALMGVVAAASGKSDALLPEDVDRDAIARFLKGYKLVGDNSSYLSEQFIARQGATVDAFINYENWLLALNRSGKLREPLVLLYPNEGVSTADYPFMLLDEGRQAEYLKVVSYLKSAPAQLWLARQTLRRPVNTEVASQAGEVLPEAGLRVELPFSPSRALADGLIDAYLNEFRRPIASTFVLDTSGSMMREGRREQLVKALHDLAGADASLTGRLARLGNREQLWMLPFAESPGEITPFEIPQAEGKRQGVAAVADSEAKRQALGQVRDYADQLTMRGGTALYSTLLKALEHSAQQRSQLPGHQFSVVAFTDGESNSGVSFKEFERRYAALPEDARAIPVFMVLFGEANEQELQRLVKVTGGKVFDARKTPLYAVFKDIRSYQ
jgi:Ca-activated chloride channel family protein